MHLKRTNKKVPFRHSVKCIVCGEQLEQLLRSRRWRGVRGGARGVWNWQATLWALGSEGLSCGVAEIFVFFTLGAATDAAASIRHVASSLALGSAGPLGQPLTRSPLWSGANI
jgi:hypothetical protein